MLVLCYIYNNIVLRVGKCNFITLLPTEIEIVSGIPYTTHRVQIPPTPSLFFFILCFFLFLYSFQVRLSQGQACPTLTWSEKRFSQGPVGLGPPAGARNRRKKQKGVICAPKAKHGIVPNSLQPDKNHSIAFIYPALLLYLIYYNMR